MNEEPFIGGDEFAYLQEYPFKKQPKELPESLKKEIQEDPYYFVYQGGSDGSFGHAEFLEKYGKWEPDASDLAAKLLEEKGLDW